MPTRAMRLTVTIGPADGTGGPDHAITFTVPDDGQPGFTPTPTQQSKLATVFNQFSVAISNNDTPL